jgi:hypothetical protein
MFELPTEPSSIVLEIANVRAIMLITQNDNDTDPEISENESEHLGKFTLSSDIKEDELDNRQEIPHLDQVRHDMTIRTTRVPPPKKRSRADTIIGRTSLPNLRHPGGAMAPPLLKHQKSTINIPRESDIVQALPLPKVGEDHNMPQLMPSGGDHNVPQHQKATFEVAKWFMQAIACTKTPWPIIYDEKYSTVDEA